MNSAALPPVLMDEEANVGATEGRARSDYVPSDDIEIIDVGRSLREARRRLPELLGPLDLIRDCLARIAWVREEDDRIVREQALEDLEHDLAGWLGRETERREA